MEGTSGSKGLPAADWVLIDADDVIVHIFRPEVRNFYNLERMWAFGDEFGCKRGGAGEGTCDSLRSFLSLLAFVAQPAAAASSPSLSSLEQQLSSLVAGKSADVGIAALDLNTGESVSIKGNTPFPMASTVKVAVAALYLAQVDHGRRSLDDTISGVPVRTPDGADADPQRQSRDRHPVQGPRRPERAPRLAAAEWRQRAFASTAPSPSCSSDKRDLWDRRDSSTPQGDGRAAAAHLQGPS